MGLHAVTVGLDTVWVVLTAAMIFFMEGGFALLEAGFVRSKNAVSITMKVIVDLTVGVLGYFLVGFGVMFGLDKAGILGTTGFALKGNLGFLPIVVPVDAYWLFQAAFAVAAISIVSGAVSERMKFKSYIVFTFIMTAIIYPLSGHWIWGVGGWLSNMGMRDFAGSAAIHAMAGWGALAAAMVLGPRIGKFARDGSINVFPPSNVPLAAAGGFILWFGWFGFNAGSTLNALDGGLAHIALTTCLAAAAGGASAIIVTMFRFEKADPAMAINGFLAGLVAITAGCAYVGPVSAIIIGAIAGLLVVFSVGWVDRIRVDDPVGAVAVHGVNGAFGAIAVGLFSSDKGLFFGGGWHLFGVQLLGTVVVSAWGFGATWVAFRLIKSVMGVRVSSEDELDGLDIASHGVPAYDLSDSLPEIAMSASLTRASASVPLTMTAAKAVRTE